MDIIAKQLDRNLQFQNKTYVFIPNEQTRGNSGEVKLPEVKPREEPDF